ncbi:lactate utilization protein [Geomonas sp. Red32]|uniref:LutC/YkgG family protein n=1 Tax=Geomonas sp. Red32 TaxID=2912856 RepID=UPI00202CF7DA|nr:lactate utilization protein [Geomonas sp. Red32]MCM0082653.1 lactate utilization protein [Geomonas sp. Red32]
MYDQFSTKATAVGAEVHRFATVKGAVEFLLPFLKAEGMGDEPGRYALWANGPVLAGLEKGSLQAAGLSFEVSRELASQARFGISQVDFALADTGSLVQDQSAIEQRLVSSLPEIHVAIAATGSILDGKIELFKRLNPTNSRYIAFITGPSRTADIERVLTIGVHGPQRLVILFIDELGGDR